MEDYVPFSEYARAIETRDAQIAKLTYSVDVLCADLIQAKTEITEQRAVIASLIR